MNVHGERAMKTTFAALALAAARPFVLPFDFRPARRSSGCAKRGFASFNSAEFGGSARACRNRGCGPACRAAMNARATSRA
ncbi:hypothetical protein C7S16_5339 [Burkholderia thailandensis]|uniref:Uncharacterized protein n=1 Tax=Burkholderia thailandensis TaxID=57975 RepID=A0AAW9CL27_BURTH|nr:hypothetical protein [Burkholderia thailandensis]